jgi:hypothetical protein
MPILWRNGAPEREKMPVLQFTFTRCSARVWTPASRCAGAAPPVHRSDTRNRGCLGSAGPTEGIRDAENKNSKIGRRPLESKATAQFGGEKVTESGEPIPCPNCAELIQRKATLCRFFQRGVEIDNDNAIGDSDFRGFWVS